MVQGLRQDSTAILHQVLKFSDSSLGFLQGIVTLLEFHVHFSPLKLGQLVFGDKLSGFDTLESLFSQLGYLFVDLRDEGVDYLHHVPHDSAELLIACSIETNEFILAQTEHLALLPQDSKLLESLIALSKR